MNSEGMRKRAKRLEAQVLADEEYSRVVILFEGETDEDAERKFLEQNGGKRPPPEIDGPDYIVITMYCER